MTLLFLEENALDLLGFDGKVSDTLAELRRKWGWEIPVLFDQRLDTVVIWYMTFEHDDEVRALGQELTAFGWGLYDFDDEDGYLLVLIPEAERNAFEKRCRKENHPFQLMPCRKSRFPDDAYYTVQEIAGYFACGVWTAREEEQRGKFVADLRKRPLEPVKVKWRDFRELTYSPELDFYAAIYTAADTQEVLGGKDPAKVNDWLHLTPKSMPKLGSLYWLGPYLCTGDEESALILEMNERRCQDAQRFIFSAATDTSCRFAMDGLNRLYINRGHEGSKIFRYVNHDLLRHTFCRDGYDELDNSIPVPGTPRLLMIRKTWGGGETKGNLFELDMDTGRHRIAPLPSMGENLKLRPFIDDWVLTDSSSDDFRTDLPSFGTSGQMRFCASAPECLAPISQSKSPLCPMAE